MMVDYVGQVTAKEDVRTGHIDSWQQEFPGGVIVSYNVQKNEDGSTEIIKDVQRLPEYMICNRGPVTNPWGSFRPAKDSALDKAMQEDGETYRALGENLQHRELTSAFIKAIESDQSSTA